MFNLGKQGGVEMASMFWKAAAKSMKASVAGNTAWFQEGGYLGTTCLFFAGEPEDIAEAAAIAGLREKEHLRFHPTTKKIEDLEIQARASGKLVRMTDTGLRYNGARVLCDDEYGAALINDNFLPRPSDADIYWGGSGGLFLVLPPGGDRGGYPYAVVAGVWMPGGTEDHFNALGRALMKHKQY